jgi:hypothetical protein
MAIVAPERDKLQIRRTGPRHRFGNDLLFEAVVDSRGNSAQCSPSRLLHILSGERFLTTVSRCSLGASSLGANWAGLLRGEIMCRQFVRCDIVGRIATNLRLPRIQSLYRDVSLQELRRITRLKRLALLTQLRTIVVSPDKSIIAGGFQPTAPQDFTQVSSWRGLRRSLAECSREPIPGRYGIPIRAPAVPRKGR